VCHGAQAKPLQQLLRSHGAYTPPYSMSVQEMKQAIRAGHAVVRHVEFLGNVMQKGNAELLDLYLDSDATVVKRMNCWSGVIYPRSPALVRRLLARTGSQPTGLARQDLSPRLRRKRRPVRRGRVSRGRRRHQRPGPRVQRDALGRGGSLLARA